jgi:hypothetical protein
VLWDPQQWVAALVHISAATCPSAFSFDIREKDARAISCQRNLPSVTGKKKSTVDKDIQQ